RDLFFDVEQDALVPAEHDARRRILGPDGANVEPADRVLAAQEQLLENRQLRGSGKRVDVGDLPAHAERETAAVLQIGDAFEQRLVVVRVAAEAGQVDRGCDALARGREDRLIDRVVDVGGYYLADDPLPVRTLKQRVGKEGIAREHGRLLIELA